ncbi:hypothetical protein F4782DRAFT_551441 [Xylaria castorea]|nr:hypothetical protein F4782DRAFT_551441 [Xylaria castorea]
MLGRQHGIYSSIAYDFGELPSHNINLLDHDLWRSSEPVWHLDSFAIQHQAPDQFGHSREQQPLTGITSSNHCHQVTNLSTPSDEWPPNLPLDTTCTKYRNHTTPTIATLYPPSPHHDFVTSTETLQLKTETGRDNEFSLPVSPTSLDEGPRSRKKRNRNRLAAAKCRKKAKRGVDDLQQRERDLLRENKMLNAEAGFLREEVLQLKSEILRHSNCDNDYIHHYIQKAAQQIGAQAEDSNSGIPDASAVS